MNYRLMGFAPLLAVAVAASAHAQSANSQGQMVSPAPAATGEVTTPTGPAKTTPPAAKPASKQAAAAAPGAAPTKQGMAAARELASKPSDTPVPYVDFAPAPGAKSAAKTVTTSHHAKPAAKKPSA